jgi:hypothetical protein
MFSREISGQLNLWKQKENRKPLILRGARQVGKTTLVHLFSKNFKQYIYLNLDLLNDRRIFENARSFDDLLDAIYFAKNAHRREKDTLIFIDEIQNSSDAIKYLRYFFEMQKELSVIAAGSLLETLIDKEISFPVGRVEYLAVRPFSFREFLAAGNFNNELEVLNKIPFPDYAHDKLLELFRKYTLVGGMPEIVKLFFETGDLAEIKNTINNLLIGYKEDVEKYARNESASKVLRHIIENAWSFAAERITFNNFAGSNYRSREVSEAFKVLEKTMLLRLVYPTTAVKMPLISNRKMSPKLHLLDTGLVNFKSGIEKDFFTDLELTDVYKGKIAEHIIGQELLSKNHSPEADLTFWTREKRQSSAELDYLINYEGKVTPVEVKSGASGKMRSLNIFMNLSNVNAAVRFYSGKLSISKEKTIESNYFTLINLPFYLCHKLEDYLNYGSNYKF